MGEIFDGQYSLTESSVAKKIRIMFMLGAGGLATATNFVRLWLLVTPNSFMDITYNFAKFNLLG